MSGRYDPGPQSGGRPPAPGRLGLVQAFVNSHFDLGADRGADALTTPAGLGAWLDERGLGTGRAPSPAQHTRALAAREALRALLAAHNGAEPQPAALAPLAAPLPAALRVEPGGTVAFEPAAPGVDGALGLVLAVISEAQAAGTWRRLKACPGPHCGWAFYDHSRNNSSAWCSMRVCGGRVKARAYRARSRG